MSLIGSAHDYVRSSLGDLYSPQLTDLNIIEYVGCSYPTGWAGFRADYYAMSGETDSEPIPESTPEPVEQTILQQRAYAERVMGRRIRVGELDEILKISISDDATEVKISVRCHETQERSNRIVVKKSGIRLITYTADENFNFTLKPTRHTFWDDEPDSDLVLWGRINTPERLDDQLDQASLCYRPGTGKTPMDGDVVRNQADVTSIRLFGLGGGL